MSVVTEWAGARSGYRNCPGSRHWGPNGAAGALAWTIGRDGRTYVLLAKRSAHVQNGGTWAFPGGAIDGAESALEAAVRELQEEVTGCTPEALTAVLEAPCAHNCGWQYTTFLVKARGPQEGDRNVPQVRVAADAANAWETDVVAWLPVEYVDELNLHPGFAATWPELRRIIAGHDTNGSNHEPDSAWFDADGIPD